MCWTILANYVSGIKLVISRCCIKRHFHLISKPSASLSVEHLISRGTSLKQHIPLGLCGFLQLGSHKRKHPIWSPLSCGPSLLLSMVLCPQNTLPVTGVLAWPDHTSLGSRWGFAWHHSEHPERANSFTWPTGLDHPEIIFSALRPVIQRSRHRPSGKQI